MRKKQEKAVFNRAKLLEYLSEPDNPFISRIELSTKVLGYKQPRSLYAHFTPLDLAEIENEALEERKRRSARCRAVVYDALYKEAQVGNVPAAKEYLDRTEGKVKDKTEHSIGTVNPDLLKQLAEILPD